MIERQLTVSRDRSRWAWSVMVFERPRSRDIVVRAYVSGFRNTRSEAWEAARAAALEGVCA